ncbi:MAG TPA: hypothetical protein VFV19_06885 [Candidatus Polarisedimenticolaceae bacterium]|nr:hypothetical protein [Candidatus Polarisedimenticolaceae bacterium]
MSFLGKLFGSTKTPKPCRVEVWHVTLSPPPYYVARCDCEWVGQCFDEAEPARLEAKSHSANVEPEIVEFD